MTGFGWAALFQSLSALIAVLSKAAARRIEEAAHDEQRRLGRLQALTETLADTVALIEDADAARHAFRDRLRADPDSLYDDDGYRREDRQKPSIRDRAVKE